MTLTELLTQSYLIATGKPTPPATGNSKYQRLLGAANIFIRSWENEPNTDWQSLYRVFDAGTITATDSFALPDEVNYTSQEQDQISKDRIYIEHTDGKRTYFDLVNHQNLSDAYDVAIRGNQVVFKNAFEADDDQFGGTLFVPGYAHAATLVDGTDIVPVDSPNWLIFMTAAEYVRNDLTRKTEFANLIGYAQSEMAKMKQKNAVDEIAADSLPLGDTTDDNWWRD